MGEGALSYPVHPESGSQMPGTPISPLPSRPNRCSVPGAAPGSRTGLAAPPAAQSGCSEEGVAGSRRGARGLPLGEQPSRPAFLLPAAWNSGERADAPAAIVGYEVTPRWETHGRSFRTE